MPLKFTVKKAQPVKEIADLIAVGVWSQGSSKKKTDKSPLDGFDRALGGALLKATKRDEFRGKKDSVLSLQIQTARVKANKLVAYGLGERSAITEGDIRIFCAKAARTANTERAKRLVIGLPQGAEAFLRAAVEGAERGAYRFTKYLTGDRKPKAELAQVTITTVAELPANAKDMVSKGQATAAGVNLSRDLSNEPPNEIFPDTLTAAAAAMAKDHGLKIQVFNFAELKKRGMKLLQAVGQGSEHKPAFAHISYVPAKPKKKIVVVGKGVTFDSGGLSIKPAAGMGDMRHDMSGAANVIGLMAIIGALKPDVEVHGIFAAAENMPDGGAYRPGDLWGSLDGQTVEILNTDPEGRLILADALAYARELKPDLLIDNATLTGACVVALGSTCSGWYSTNEETALEFSAAVKVSGEQMWRLPLVEELKDQLKSDTADLKHTGDRWGGSISAALFLREFIGSTKNWIHCDIAGPAIGDRIRGWDPKGGTGHGVITFLKLIENAGV
jgi:leucyl aminopeptidase